MERKTKSRICPHCNKKFPPHYWGMGNLGQFGTSRKLGIAKYDFEGHVKACGKPRRVPKYRMRTVSTHLLEKRRTGGTRVKFILECGHVVKPTYTVSGIIYGKTKVRCYECARNELKKILQVKSDD